MLDLMLSNEMATTYAIQLDLLERGLGAEGRLLFDGSPPIASAVT